jgi:hypothetical protein
MSLGLVFLSGPTYHGTALYSTPLKTLGLKKIILGMSISVGNHNKISIPSPGPSKMP